MSHRRRRRGGGVPRSGDAAPQNLLDPRPEVCAQAPMMVELGNLELAGPGKPGASCPHGAPEGGYGHCIIASGADSRARTRRADGRSGGESGVPRPLRQWVPRFPGGPEERTGHTALLLCSFVLLRQRTAGRLRRSRGATAFDFSWGASPCRRDEPLPVRIVIGESRGSMMAMTPVSGARSTRRLGFPFRGCGSPKPSIPRISFLCRPSP